MKHSDTQCNVYTLSRFSPSHRRDHHHTSHLNEPSPNTLNNHLQDHDDTRKQIGFPSYITPFRPASLFPRAHTHIPRSCRLSSLPGPRFQRGRSHVRQTSWARNRMHTTARKQPTTKAFSCLSKVTALKSFVPLGAWSSILLFKYLYRD